MADYPLPIPGLVIRYSYLWKREADLGRVEGQKDRPCVVVICIEDIEGEQVVTVAPITHSPPTDLSRAIQLTSATRRRLGLDEETNWVVASEVNSFCWPGPDMTPTPTGEYAYGELPAVVFEALKQKLLSGSTTVAAVQRTE